MNMLQLKTQMYAVRGPCQVSLWPLNHTLHAVYSCKTMIDLLLCYYSYQFFPCRSKWWSNKKTKSFNFNLYVGWIWLWSIGIVLISIVIEIYVHAKLNCRKKSQNINAQSKIGASKKITSTELDKLQIWVTNLNL